MIKFLDSKTFAGNFNPKINESDFQLSLESEAKELLFDCFRVLGENTRAN